ncbi:MAG: serine hydrolase domain-containing protein [Draconibacterium sp.]
MKSLYLIIALAVVTLFFQTQVAAQGTEKLPRSTPEQEGVSSAGIMQFLNACDTNGLENHSFMMLRHGKIITEGWWKPYGPEYKHIMFSASKTFTATAVGLAVAENRLKVTDKIITFFPYSLPDSISNYMKEMTVKDLLTMSAGQDPEPSAWGAGGDWMTTFISTEPKFKPGSVFKYNNMATFMLSAIVQQVTGETVFDYLLPRIFKPLGIRGIDWDLNPQGITMGMIGLRLRTEDLAKFGQLLLNGGVWNGKQLIPKEWVKEATAFHIKNSGPEGENSKSDWEQGYAYQMWRGKNNTVRLDGMAGQFVVLIPDKDAIVVFTANNTNTQKQLDLMHNFLIPAIKSDKPLAPAPATLEEMTKKAADLNISPGFEKSAETGFEKSVSGKEFILSENDHKIQSVYVSFKEGVCTFAIKRENAVSSIKAGAKEWQVSNTLSASLLAPPRSNFSKSVDANYTILKPNIKVAAQYAWTEEKTLEITGRFVEEALGSETIVCKFSEQNNEVRVTIEPKTPARAGRGFGPQQPVVLRGTMVRIE